MRSSLILTILFLTVSTVFGQERILISDKTAQRLDDSQLANEWTRARMFHSARAGTLMVPRVAVSAEQAMAIIEVAGTAQSVEVVFQSLVPTPGSTISFRMLVPGNDQPTNMGSYKIPNDWTNSTAGFEFWGGRVSGSWPSGLTLFEAILISSSGQLTYVSAQAPFNSCCSLTGPLDRADVSADGNTIAIGGTYLWGDTLVTINGQQFPVAMSFSPTTGASIGKIDVHDVYEGQKTLTVCSGGNCSSRVIYVTRRGTTATPSAPSN